MKKDDEGNSAVNEDTHEAQTSPAASVMMDVVVKKDALPEIVPKGTVLATEVGKVAENMPECEIAAVMKKDDEGNSAINQDTLEVQSSFYKKGTS